MHINDLTNKNFNITSGYDFKNGFASVEIRNSDNQTYCTYINENGELCPHLFVDAYSYAPNGLALVRDFDDFYYYINQSGIKIFGPFYNATSFNDAGFSYVQETKNGRDKILTSMGELINHKSKKIEDNGDGYLKVLNRPSYLKSLYSYVYIVDYDGNVLKDKNGEPIRLTESYGNFDNDWMLVSIDSDCKKQLDFEPMPGCSLDYKNSYKTYVNKNGEFFPYVFENATCFTEDGLASVQVNLLNCTKEQLNNTWVVIDKQGKFAIKEKGGKRPKIFDKPLYFHQGRATNRVDGSFYTPGGYSTYIDTKGECLRELNFFDKMVPMRFLRAGDFNEGGLAISMYGSERKYQLFNKSGKPITDKYEHIEFDKTENMYFCQTFRYGSMVYQMLNKKGKALTDLNYKSIGSFNNGLALAEIKLDYYNSEFTYLTPQGKELGVKFAQGRSFSDGYACVTTKDNKLVYINTDGKIINKSYTTEYIAEDSSDNNSVKQTFAVFAESLNPNKTKSIPAILLLDKKPLTNDELLKEYIKTGTSVFLHGPSGVGKSTRVKELDPTATRITLRPMMNPEEVDGILDRETGDYIPPLWYTQLKEKCENEPERKHILFIDELTNVKPSIQSLVYSIVLDKAGKDGLWPLPENSVVVVAGNETKGNLAAHPLTNALHRRFCHLYYDVNKSDWVKWVTKKEEDRVHEIEHLKIDKKTKIHPAVLTYVMSRKNVLNQDLDEENPTIVTDPRKWEIASDILYATKNCYSLVPAVGNKISQDFMNFVSLLQSGGYDLDSVQNKEVTKNYLKKVNMATKMATIVKLIDTPEQDLSETRQIILDTLGKDMLNTFDALWIQNDVERALAIQDSKLEDETVKTTETTDFDSQGEALVNTKDENESNYNFVQDQDSNLKLETESNIEIETDEMI